MYRLSLLLLSLTGCSEYSSKSDAEMMDTGSNLMAETEIQRSFRIDVYPSDAVDSLLPQSFQLDGISDYIGLDIDLQPTVSISGSIVGYDINPTSDIVVPGENQSIEGRIELSQPGSIASAVAYSSPAGDFDILAPAGEYDLLISPIIPSNLPFHVIETFDLQQDETIEVDIGSGRPFFGTITSDSEPLTGATVQVFDLYTNTPSAKQELDENGQFRLRLPIERDEFRVEVSSLTNDIPIPTIVETIQFSLDADYFEWEADVGPINETTVRGTLRHPNGDIYQERALIRFTAIELDENSGTLIIETNNDSNGTFRADLLPGRWAGYIIPPYGEDPSVAPTEIELIIEDNGNLQLGDISLSESVTVVGNVFDPQGLPASSVLFTCKETGFDNNAYTTSTNTDGQFSLKLPPSPCDATLTPLSNTAAIQNYYFSTPSSEQVYEIRLESGTEISGTLRFESEIIPFALVEIRDDENNLLGTTLSDNEGRFNLRLSLLE